MRSKRLFAMLLVLCLVVSALSPAAFAVKAGEDSYVNADKTSEENASTDKTTTSPFENDLVVSGKDVAEGTLNLRDNPIIKGEVNSSSSDGSWVATPSEGTGTSPLVSSTPDCLEELRKAAEVFKKDEIVSAFVVMEDKPLAESYSSPKLVSTTLEKQMIEKQDSVIASIEKMVLGGKKLEVRYQFTYLTNSFTINTEFANLEKIASMPGVKSVFVMPVYEACATAAPNTAASGAMTGVHTVWQDLGFSGEGMKIAIIDTGLDLDHPSFAADPETTDSSMTQADIAEVLTELNAYAMDPSITTGNLYRSAKVPYAFNYVDRSLTADHSRDDQGDHGTHVAGIAAANATEGTTVVGMAPDAQIIVMKVFGANGGAYTDDFVAAIEDAMLLGCDVANLSLGSPSGFSSTDTEIDLIFERIASQDMVVTMSAGNEGTSSYGNTWGTNLNRTQNPENGVVGSPSLYANGFSIASAENSVVMTDYITLAGGEQIFYMDPIEYLNFETDVSLRYLQGMDAEYVIVPGLGYVEDFYDPETGASIVEGKVAVISRGELNFSDKIVNAQNAGAIGAIIWNNTDEDIFVFGMSIATTDGFIPGLPAALVSLADGQKMADAEVKTLSVSLAPGERVVEGGQMSSFSSWGTTSDLRLVPDITGIGGNVYSCYDGGKYGLMSGTSMSAPQIAGVSALVMQYLYTVYPNVPSGTIRELAEALMMSTADPIVSSDSGVEASPRQQGAGLVNAAEAVKSGAYLTVGGNRPKVELHDNTSGIYSFSFEIHNYSDTAKTYTLDASLLTEAVVSDGLNYYMAGYDLELTGSVTFDKDTVTVPAGGTSNVTATVELSEDDKAYFAAAWENGGYVEGYVYLENADENGVDLNLPFFGFYGDWTEAPVYDTAYWYDNSFFGFDYANGLPEGDEYYHAIWTDLGGTDWVLGMNPYSGGVLGEDGKLIYDPANNVLSPNGDGLLDGIADIYLSLLRNVKYLTFNYSIDGQTVFAETITNVPKTMYISAYGQVVPFIYSWNGWGTYDFTDANGNPLPNGTEVLLTITADIDYKTGGDNVMQIPIIIDTQAPELISITEQRDEENDTNALVIEVSEDRNLAAMILMNPTGTRILAEAYEFEKTENGTVKATVDITNMGTEFSLVLGDYAANETYYDVTYTADEDGNKPIMDTSLLYAYRVMDPIIYSDYMFGWISMNKPENDETGNNASWINAETSDYMEYYAINAAEYAGGKIFAVDAGYNFLVLDPGLWNRQTICNLGMNVLDMTFDDSTDTMYLLASDEWDDSYLYSVDLITGEMNNLSYLGYMYNAPWVITDDDNGTLYTVLYGGSNLYTMDPANDYALETVNDETGTAITYYDSYGYPVSPNYSQSMTFADGKIYWAYFNGSYYGNTSELITIDPANGYSATNTYFATYYPDYGQAAFSDTEMVGLMSFVETDYQIPEATELNSLQLSSENVVLSQGQSAKVTVNPDPWNYELGELTWTSSNETVATVDNGRITAVGEGVAFVTVTHGDLSAQCMVSVVNVSGNFYAYNYYSEDGNYGYMIDVDMQTMDYSLMFPAPADFLAGDYNGHDGCFYGYAEGGQLYRFDMYTGEYAKIGAPTGINPTDMAYDYSSGYMYAVSVDYMGGFSTLYAVDMNTGKLLELGVVYDYLMTLACDAEGNLYSINYMGTLCQLMEDEWGLYGMPIMEELGYLQYQQSMCYDHVNDVLLWTNPEMSVVYWIDHNADVPYMIDLGDPTESGLIEFVGMFTIPEVIPELPDVAVEYVSAEDMVLMTGAVSMPNVSILPLNANGYTVSMTSSDESVAFIDESGAINALAAGEATITVTVQDAISGVDTEITFNVSVVEGVDNLYGYMMTDIATYSSNMWVQLPVTDPSSPEMVGYTNYTIYAEEYVDGKLYAFGFDGEDWEANWQMMVIDPETYAIESMTDLGPGYPFVYDVTYDYTTGTMYAVAGPSDTASDLYVVDMQTGALIPIMETEQFFLSLAAGPDGTLYAIEQSLISGDAWDPWAPVEMLPADIYIIDPLAGTCELLGSTGQTFYSLGSMTYDYDTDYLYWTVLDQNDYTGGLALVDPATGNATVLGTIGAAGAQVTGLYTICENYPATSDSLSGLLVTPAKTSLTVGDSITVKAVTLPMSLDAETVWTSSNANVATVDANGVVTGVAQGAVTITATVTYGGVTMTGTCDVAVLKEGASFLTYNVTDGGWAMIDRSDATIVTNLTEGEDAPLVTAIAAIGTSVYGYDVNNTLFSLNTETYERTELGTVDATALAEAYLESFGYVDDPANYGFEIRDLAYDAANDRLLALGNVYDLQWGEVNGGNSIYEVSLTDGSLELLYTSVDDYNIMAMDVGTDGTVYYYEAYSDYYKALDLETGAVDEIVSLQTLGVYGDYENSHDLYYDALTDTLYHLFTGNGTFYRMYTVDLSTGLLNEFSEFVGDVYMDYDTWMYVADLYNGLTFINEPAPEAPPAPVYEVVFKTANTNMDTSNINLNFFVTLSDDIVTNETAEMHFTFNGTTQVVPMSGATVSVKDGVTRYVFACSLPAKHMADDVVAQMYVNGEPVGNSKTYSIQAYCEAAIAAYGAIEGQEDLIALMKAMLNYGAAAQVHFGHNTDNLANASLSDADKVLAEVDASAYALQKIGAEDGIKAKGVYLVLETDTVLRVTFQLTGDKAIDEYTFTVDGQEVTPVLDGDRYYIELAGVSATELDEAHDFTVGGLTVSCSVLSYVQLVETNNQSEDLKDLAKAIFAFHAAAEAYFG